MKRQICVLFAVALIASACGGDAPTAGDGGIAALEEVSTPPTPEKANKKKAPGSGTETKRSKKKGSSTTSGEGAPPSSGANQGEPVEDGGSGGAGQEDRAAATAIPSGTFDYATQGRRTISGNSEQLPETTTLTAEDPSSGEQRQLRDLRDRDGNGTLTESRLLYRSDGVYLTYVKVTSRFQGGLTDVREFKLSTPELIAPSDAAPGFKRSFSMEGSGTRADVSIKAVAYDKVSVGGSAVKALVVETRISFSGSLEGEQDSVTWFWPKHALAVKEQVETDVTNGPVRLQSNYEATLKRLP